MLRPYSLLHSPLCPSEACIKLSPPLPQVVAVTIAVAVAVAVAVSLHAHFFDLIIGGGGS